MIVGFFVVVGLLFAGMLIGIVPVLLLYTLLSHQITRAMAQGAVKG